MAARQRRKEVAGVSGLQVLKVQRDSTARAIDVEVRRARRAGVSWREIGEALGVTQQAASRRWGPYPTIKAPTPTGRSRTRKIPEAQPL